MSKTAENHVAAQSHCNIKEQRKRSSIVPIALQNMTENSLP